MKKIAIIDGNSLINRAYYALRNPMITRDGIYTHGIYGFINMMDKIIGDYGPEYMAIAFDLKAPTFRHKEYDAYKAGRKKMPPELAMQIPLLKDVLDAMKIRRIEVEGYEADDIIGTLAKKGEAAGLEPLIFTGDRDQLQLATDITKVIYTKRGVSEFDMFDWNSFVEEYQFTPLQFIDFKGLSGDASDNIPGIPGVGAKTATKLIKEYESVENIIASADSIKPAGLQKKVKENAQQALMSKRLATIFTEVPIDITVEDCLMGQPDFDALIEIYRKLEFNRFLSRLKTSGQVSEDGAGLSEELPLDIKKPSDFTLKVVLEGSLDEIDLSGQVVIKTFGDKNHLKAPALQGIALLCGDTCYYFSEQVLPALLRRLETSDIEFIGHNLKDDYYMLNLRGGFKTAFDTQIAQYVLDSGRSNYSLESLCNEYLHQSIKSYEEFLEENSQTSLFGDNADSYASYGLSCCIGVLNIMSIQKRAIAEQNLERVFYEVELPLVEVLASMEREGVRADRKYLSEFGDELSGEIDKLAGSIHDMAGQDFNINSTLQLGEILFEKLCLPHGKKTKRGYSTGAEVLEKIRDKHPIVNEVLEYRSLTKLKSTYVDGLVPLINSEDERIHAHFMQTVTTTGRISCIEPNLQNIPIRQELGRQLRKAFVPNDSGCTLVGADYSQIELRVLAHMSEDDALISAFNRGEDIHRATAANVLGLPEESITIEERSRAKAVNFGVIYGMSSFGLSGELNITRKDAENYIEAYFSKHEAVKAFMDDAVNTCKERGYVTTIMGRKRYIKEIKATQYMVRQAGERLAMNSPIQGSAADIIKIAMVKVFKALREAGLKSKLILQIHDELIINTYPEEREAVKKLLTENMEAALSLKVELKAELNEGTNWYELK